MEIRVSCETPGSTAIQSISVLVQVVVEGEVAWHVFF